MIRRLFLVFIFLGLSACVMPDYIPPSTLDSNNKTPVFTPGTGITQIADATHSLPEKTDGVKTTIPVDDETPQPTSLPSTPQKKTTNVPEVLPTPYIYSRYLIQSGSPTWVQNFLHPEAGCNWLGVGGQVFDLQGNAVPNLIVKLTGSLNGEIVDLYALTGGTLNLGPGGYEFKLSDHPMTSTEPLSISVFDKDGNAISDQLAISTYDSCDKNLIIVNFSEAYIVGNGLKMFLPLISLGRNP
jgi:hypothetical protein